MIFSGPRFARMIGLHLARLKKYSLFRTLKTLPKPFPPSDGVGNGKSSYARLTSFPKKELQIAFCPIRCGHHHRSRSKKFHAHPSKYWSTTRVTFCLRGSKLRGGSGNICTTCFVYVVATVSQNTLTDNSTQRSVSLLT